MMNRRAALFAASWMYSVSFKVKIKIKRKGISESAENASFSKAYDEHAF